MKKLLLAIALLYAASASAAPTDLQRFERLAGKIASTALPDKGTCICQDRSTVQILGALRRQTRSFNGALIVEVSGLVPFFNQDGSLAFEEECQGFEPPIMR